MNEPWELKWLDRLISIIKFFGGKRLSYSYKNRALLRFLQHHHSQVVHPIRSLGCQMARNWDRKHAGASKLAQEIVTKSREAMSQLLEVGDRDLHCCLKVMVKVNRTDSENRVATWVRSKPLDHRPYESEKPYKIEENTVWSCLLGRNDGLTNWRQGFNTFACNDLEKAGALFRCRRDNWQDYYKSALVFPIRYPLDDLEEDFGHVGFLAFDSPKTEAFIGLPNVFDFRDEPNAFKSLLDESVLFHLGAVFVDMLGGTLGPAYKEFVLTQEA